MTAPNTPAQPRPAATLILVRDGADGIETLMITRHGGASFAAGAAVFPGGRVDVEEEQPLIPHARGLDGLPADDALARLAALRETVEEAGILLVRHAGGDLLAPEALVLPSGAALADHLATAGLQLAADLLVPFAHWITPVVEPKRFDARFYIAAVPPGFGGGSVPDGREAVHAAWTTPAAALAAFGEGRLVLFPPTELSLARIGESASAAEAVARAQATPVVPIMPELIFTEDGVLHRLPAGCGYDVAERRISPSVARLLRGGR
jgi:8-oxo-dGTP pyrophosphatase MutT (NUDIX family)